MFPEPSEEMRLKLLEQERAMRKKQPESWTKKFRMPEHYYDSIDKLRQKREYVSDKAKVLGFLREHCRPVLIADVLENCDVSRESAKKILSKLEQENLVQKSKHKNGYWDLWQLTEGTKRNGVEKIEC